MIASFAEAASRMKFNATRPFWPVPTKASSQPASARRSTKASASDSLSESAYFKVNSYSIAHSESADFFAASSIRRWVVQLSTTRFNWRA
jgi:hypothetical protein